jgi:hypothetical protein
MPLCSDIDDLPHVLKGDRAKPEADQPAFLIRWPTDRQRRQWQAIWSDAHGRPDTHEGLAESEPLLEKLFGLAITGWRNMKLRGEPVQIHTVKYADLLTSQEIWELAAAVLYETSMKETDRKKSGSPQASAAEPSAAPAVSPNAPTPA